MDFEINKPPLVWPMIHWRSETFSGMESQPHAGHRLSKHYGAFISEYHFINFAMRLREAVANYMASEGCCCCEGESHDDDKAALARLLGVMPYPDNSGYDFSQYKTPRGKDAQETES